LTILDSKDAIEYLLNPARSGPVVALDTEFDTSGDTIPTCQAKLTGLSMAGGTPETGFQGAFWSYKEGRITQEWGYLRDKLIFPIFGDPNRTVVMHPPKTDMQILRARGLDESRVRARVECTMSQVHVYDENLPKGLKDLGQHILHLDVVTHSQMQAKMKALSREGKKLAKAILKEAWETYKEHRKPKDALDEVVIDPTWPSWKKLTMRLPKKLTKGEMEERLAIIHKVIDADYTDRAHKEFEHYGALDALITVAIRYFLKADTPPHFAPHIERETLICHPLVTEMEERGLHIDVDRLRVIHDAMKAALDTLRADVIRLWGVQGEEVTANKEGEFNPGSPEQIQRKLWIEWDLRPPPWTQERDGDISVVKPKYRAGKLGLCTTDKDVMAWLATHAPEPQRTACAKLQEFRKYDKLFGTFVAPMLDRALRDPERRVHPSSWPVGARTGRFSQSEPNCENVPRPSSMPKMLVPADVDPTKPPPGFVPLKDKKTGNMYWRVDSLRQVFIAPPGFKLVSVDLSQIENRLMAHESQDPMLLWIYRAWDCFECKASGETDQPLHICPNCGAKDGKRDKLHPDQPAVKGFCLGRDIHSFTSVAAGYAEKFGPEEGRERGKTLNHAFSYGMGAQTKARRDGESIKEAEAGLEAMRKRYVRVPEMQDTTFVQVKRDGEVRMFDGTTRRFKVARLLMLSGNFQSWEREGVVREAVNVKAQGGTGVIVKKGMLSARAKIREKAKTDPRWREVRLVNQIHDEICYEAPESIAEDVKDVVIWELEHAVQLTVPVLADGKCGHSWGEAH
jgi:DNA polymerase I-like protein with 3'-5' exonuclease and polymerase domains